MRISDWSSDVCSSDLDAFRPVEAQWALWNHTPDPNYVADPRKGGPHTRGAAVDLTLLRDGAPLDMGTAFDCLHPLSHHGVTDIAPEAQRNRLTLLGVMTAGGWDFYRNEWWHSQLLDSPRFASQIGRASCRERGGQYV